MNKKVNSRSIISFGIPLIWAIAAIIYFFWGNPFIQTIYDGRSFHFLNKIVEHHRNLNPGARDLNYYLHKGQTLFIIFTAVCGVLQIYLQLKVRSHPSLTKARKILNEYFNSEDSPINIAIFRIVLFGYILRTFDLQEIVWLSEVPTELRVPPFGLGWLLEYLPTDTVSLTWLGRSFILFIIMAMIGIFTHFSSSMVVILGIYLLGIPNFYGKVDHYHHLLWFAALLASCRSGDALSIDAIINAIRKADKGIITPIKSAKSYALPLRFVWILMGIVYFFPGFWKLFGGGYQWIFSDNLVNHFYQIWFELQWRPNFPIENHPFLYESGALLSIIFELTVILLVLTPKTRILVFISGLLFHNFTYLFMRIPFFALQICYVAFINWDRVFSRVGHVLFKQPMYVIYDGNCKVCRRTISTIRVFDIFKRITYISTTDSESIKTYALDWLDSNAISADMHAVIGDNKFAKGYDAYRWISLRIPFLWMLFPLLYIWPIPKIGRRIYRAVADSRTCNISYGRPQIDNTFQALKINLLPTIIVGTFLIFANSIAGVVHFQRGWPFANYPTFQDIAKPQTQTFSIEWINKDGKVISLDKSLLFKDIPPQRLKGMLNNISRNPELFSPFCDLLKRVLPDIEDATAIRFYKEEITLVPSKQNENPLKRELVQEIKFQKTFAQN